MIRQKLHLALFFAIFLAISLIEGIHTILDLRFVYFIIFIFPLLLFILDPKKKYSLPKPFVFISVFYFIASFISLINSKQFSVSIELFLRDINLFLLMIYVHVNKEEIKKYIPKLLILLSLVFIGVSLFCLSTQYGRDFIRSIRLNLLFNPAYPHKTIGDYITFAIIICAYFIFIKKETVWKYPLLILTPIFILSFSRTAYITLGISFLIMAYTYKERFKKISPILLFSLLGNVLFLCIFCIVFVTRTNSAILSFFQDKLESVLFIYSRPFIYSHLPFWIAGIKGFLLYPFTGIGQGNFQSISYRFTELMFLWSNTSFTLIIDFLAEQGIAVAIGFSALILYIVVTAQKKNIFFLLFIALLISFMGFSAYTYTQIWMLFFIIAGLVIHSAGTNDIQFEKNILFIPALFGVLYIQVLSFHFILIENEMRVQAQVLYPYNQENIETLIEFNLPNKNKQKKVARYLAQYQQNFSLDPYKLEYIGDTYLKLGEPYKKAALTAYEDSFTWGSYAYGGSLLERMRKLYVLKKELQGEQAAIQYIKSFTQEYRKILEMDNIKFQADMYDNLVGDYLKKDK